MASSLFVPNQEEVVNALKIIFASVGTRADQNELAKAGATIAIALLFPETTAKVPTPLAEELVNAILDARHKCTDESMPLRLLGPLTHRIYDLCEDPEPE